MKLRAAEVERPPRPHLGLKVGITGHRDVPGPLVARIEASLAAVFRGIAAEIAAVGAAEQHLFAAGSPKMVVVSQLAKGVDQIAARAALATGFALHAMLPRPLDSFRADFERVEDREAFDALAARAEAVWSLPVTRQERDRDYVLAGEATVAQSDLMIAVWDGAFARGPGGTAEVVGDALRYGVPVIHLTMNGAAPAILWAGFDGVAPERLRHEDAPQRPLDADALRLVLQQLVAPPAAGPERVALLHFLAERERLTRTRLEWSLLLAGTGVRRFTRRSVRAERYGVATARGWSAFRGQVETACGAKPGFDALECVFAWADGLADHYSTVYRSGIIFNFSAAAGAILLALATLFLPQFKTALASAELLLVSGIVLNTVVGTRRAWHRRWLDYRFLAEVLRPMRCLKLFGTARARLSPQIVDRRWIDWYAAAVWRSMEPTTIASPAALSSLSESIAEQEIDSQVSYHRTAAHRMHLLDHRLHLFGLTLFLATIGVGLAGLLGKLLAPELAAVVTRELGALAVALPTIGAALFGIRGAGDFGGVAARSTATAERLERASTLLRRDGGDLPVATRAIEEAATAMLADLGEWHAIYRHRKLAIPS